MVRKQRTKRFHWPPKARLRREVEAAYWDYIMRRMPSPTLPWIISLVILIGSLR